MQAKLELLRKEILASANCEVFLVGGAVRDIYLGRKIIDYDLAFAGNAFKLAQEIAPRIGASFVPLDTDHDIARLVVKSAEGNIYLDFASFKGTDIYEDLKNRDFTINAMAIPLKETCAEVFDPFGGIQDIKAQRISAISEANMLADPIRILRAVRFAVELGYTIEPETFDYMFRNRNLLKRVSAERIRDELFRSFTVDAYQTVLLLENAALFDVLIPELSAAKGVEQNKYHSLDVWEHCLATLKQLEENILVDENSITVQIQEYLNGELVQGRSRKALLKFAALIHDIGKPAVRQLLPGKGVTFWNHDLVGSNMAKEIATRFTLSKKEINFIEKIVKYHMRPLFLSKGHASARALYKFFSETGEDGLGVILHAQADTKAGKIHNDEQVEAFSQTIDMMRDFYFHEFLPKTTNPLLRGQDILLSLPKIPNNKVGEVLNDVKEAYTIGLISSREEALNYIKNKYRQF